MAKTDTAHLASRFRVTDRHFRIKDVDPADTLGLESKERAGALLQQGITRLQDLQERLYAQDRWSLLLVFQALDAAGKDSTIKHVMSGVNPQGCEVTSFKQPTAEELDHDFLWRCSKRLPERGYIGIFNRSYYEEVLVVRVHPEVLGAQKLPQRSITKHIWDERYDDINAFEKYLERNGVVIRKFFLYLSKKEQQRRFLSRLEDPKKNWKFSLADAKERGFWKDYMEAYEEAIQSTATKHAPWYIVPADKKWFARLVIASAIVEALLNLDLAFPKVDKAKKKELEEIRERLVKSS